MKWLFTRFRFINYGLISNYSDKLLDDESLDDTRFCSSSNLVLLNWGMLYWFHSRFSSIFYGIFECIARILKRISLSIKKCVTHCYSSTVHGQCFFGNVLKLKLHVFETGNQKSINSEWIMDLIVLLLWI